ncbi:MAG: YjiH family protein [Peptostreptococcaceae bacterium]|jgi:nucleoside recognition membrane protein YjiH|nr:YjiH family protein [Peptostreptococcaceae bacterium]
MEKTDESNKFKTTKNLMKFLIPSFIGILLFMTPIVYQGNVTIPVAILSGKLQEILTGKIPFIMTVLITFTFLMTLIVKITKPSFIENSKYLKGLFDVSPIWALSRALGAVFAIMTYYKLGPEMIHSGNTGGLLLNDLLPVLFAVFLFAGLFIPLLLNFGLLEFFGALLTKIMRPLFSLPGRSSIDCMASWLGDGTIGILLTSKQYEEGYYSKREACVIGTTFSAVSITFSLVVISQVGLANMFAHFYLTVLAAGVVAAVITPRIPPLSKKPDEYISESKPAPSEDIPKGHTSFSWGMEKALERASKNNDVKEFFIQGIHNVLDMWLGVAPVVMAMGTIALVFAEYTPIFKWLGMPFIPILQLLQIPEAVEASQTMVVGFADMFLPSVIGASIESPLTRFVIAALSVTQLIYMSEVGGLLLGSKIPINLKDLIIVFIERTLITLPVIALIAHMIF